MTIWKAQDAKSRFGELLDAALKKGPQIVTRHGVETAVLLTIEEWDRLRRAARPSLKDILLAPEPRFTTLIAENRKFHRRSVVKFN